MLGSQSVHVSIKKRSVGLVWFGSLSYRRLKITYEKRKMLCPLCQSELKPARYFGSKVFQKNPVKSDYKANFWSPLMEGGEIVWLPAPDLERGSSGW
jgi:hypothetical protein